MPARVAMVTQASYFGVCCTQATIVAGICSDRQILLVDLKLALSVGPHQEACRVQGHLKLWASANEHAQTELGVVSPCQFDTLSIQLEE